MTVFPPSLWHISFRVGGSWCLLPGNGWTIYLSPQDTRGGQVRGMQISTESYKQIMKVGNQVLTTYILIQTIPDFPSPKPKKKKKKR